MDAVHVRPHHQNPAAMFRKDIFGRKWVWNTLRIEPFSFVPDNKEKFSAGLASKTQVNMLGAVFVVTVNHCVGDRLAQRYFDIAPVAVKTRVMLHAFDEFIDEWRNFRNIAGHGQFELRMRRSGLPSFVQVHFCSLCILRPAPDSARMKREKNCTLRRILLTENCGKAKEFMEASVHPRLNCSKHPCI